jgi:membrane protein implicated in regulation of membrane protease activity
MDWSGATGWWVAAGVLVAAELAVGTFNLLMLALGMAAGALAAHAGLALPGQLVLAALVGGGAVVAWRIKRSRGPKPEPAQSNRDVNLDIGSQVHVTHWHADGTARVTYRGAGWNVRYQGSGAPAVGDFTIRALDGNCLLVDRQTR